MAFFVVDINTIGVPTAKISNFYLPTLERVLNIII